MREARWLQDPQFGWLSQTLQGPAGEAAEPALARRYTMRAPTIAVVTVNVAPVNDAPVSVALPPSAVADAAAVRLVPP